MATESIIEEQIPEPLQEARRLLDEGMYEQCSVCLKDYWLEHENDSRAINLFAELMKEIGRSEVARKLTLLAELLDSDSKETTQKTTTSSSEATSATSELAYALFEAGFGLIDLRQHELAVMLLDRCLTMMPDDPTVHYEIAFSKMSLSKFDEAISHFKHALDDNEDFDTILNLSVCYTLLRKIPEAKQMIEKLSELTHDDDEKHELAHRRIVLKRLELLKNKQTMTPRDWQFVLYGGILLRTGSEHVSKKEDFASIASTLAVLKGVLEGLRIEFEAVEYYNSNARPLARILAELLDVPSDNYKGPHRPDRALLVMAWATDIIGPHQAFVEHMESRSIFAYGLSWNEPLPVAPEITGLLADDSFMPWEDTHTEPVDHIISKIVARARDMECDPDILRETQDAVEYYDSKRELLILNNWTKFPDRPEYTAEIQRQRK